MKGYRHGLILHAKRKNRNWVMDQNEKQIPHLPATTAGREQSKPCPCENNAHGKAAPNSGYAGVREADRRTPKKTKADSSSPRQNRPELARNDN
jgi:hypothetical protein